MTFADELRHAASIDPAGVGGNKVARPRPPAADVLTLETGFGRLLATCRAKGLFERFVWTEMGLPGETDEAQLHAFIAMKTATGGEAAIWTPGSYCRLLVRTRPALVWSWLSVGSGLSAPDSRLAMYRALYDIGVRELHNRLHPDNPYTQAIIGRGQYTITPEGKYLHGVLSLKERP